MSSHIRIRTSNQSPVTKPVTFPTNVIAQGALPHVTPTDGSPGGLQIGEHSAYLQEFYGQATIDKLTDDALLEIFDFYLKESYEEDEIHNWHALVHVCQRWRNIVFASPHRLDLRLLCSEDRPARAMLDIWPALPLDVEYHDYHRMDTWEVRDNLITTLKHHDRVCEIALGPVPNPVWETLAVALQVPFPELTSLMVYSVDRSVPVLPDSFLGGSAPRLRTLTLRGIPFPAVRNLLVSASDLVNLELWRLPHSGYISPETMVAGLSSLNRLESFALGFQSPQPRPVQPSRPPQTRAVLPALIKIQFIAMSDYVEELVAHIDTPVLNRLYTTFFMDPVFDIPHFKQFIGHAKRHHSFKAAELLITSQFILLMFDQPPDLTLEVRCNRINQQLDSMAQICGQLSSFFSSIERLDLIWHSRYVDPQGRDDAEPTHFLEIFRPFTAIRSLYVSKTLLPFIVPALQEELIGESATEVLPNLRDLFLEGSTTSGSIQQDIRAFIVFIETRRLSGQPVAVHHLGGLSGD